jgi:type IV pilus assembly protein PilW
MADFWGCVPDIGSVTNNLDPDGTGYTEALHGFTSGLAGTDNDGLNGSDSISLAGAFDAGVVVSEPYMNNSAGTIHANDPDDVLQEDAIVLISDCLGADIFQITNITAGGGTDEKSVVHNTGSGAPGNYNPASCAVGGGNAHCLSQEYQGDASMYALRSVRYFLQPGESGEPALWMTLGSTTRELVTGVENMQITYGEDTNGDRTANRYVSLPDVADMEQVVSVRVSLLLRSEQDNLVDAPQVVTYNGGSFTAGDRRIRQVMTTTLAVRNRTL